MKEYTLKCPLCFRKVPSEEYLEKHHIVPRSKGGKETVRLCIDCGNQVHELFTNNQLRDEFNTIEALKCNVQIQRWVAWVRKQKNFGITMKKKKRV